MRRVKVTTEFDSPQSLDTIKSILNSALDELSKLNPDLEAHVHISVPQEEFKGVYKSGELA